MTVRRVMPVDLTRWSRVAPFWMSYLLPPLLLWSATQGGWWCLAMPLATWGLFSALDEVVGEAFENADPGTQEDALYWYKMGVLLWVPVQAATLFAMIWYLPRAAHLSGLEIAALAIGTGIVTGAIGITYSHELIHQRSKLERAAGDTLLAMVLYGHFRSEHLLVHHRYVGTPRDPATARYNEGFYRFLARVLWQSLRSAFSAEASQLAKKNLPRTHKSNPFWRYGAAQLGLLVLAYAIGGLTGLAVFILQALTAIWQLELINYVEHYGLTRKHLGDGRYEHVRPHHSWNAAQRASNWLLINLQRHSDHHYKPDRRFPVLQTYGHSVAPRLPLSYPVMTIAALLPPLWRRVMHPEIAQWRARHYPEIQDWDAYTTGSVPIPR